MFMFQFVGKLKMPNVFINTLRLLFEDTVMFVTINNQVIEPFELHCGVHQGCPLPLYLFIIVAKTLNVALKNMERICTQYTSQQIISQYADDMLFAMRAKECNIDSLVETLHKFELVSRLEINWHKSWLTSVATNPFGWVKKYRLKWVANEDMSKLFGTRFGQPLEL